MAVLDWKNKLTFWFIIKLVLVILTLVPSFVMFSDWYGRQTRVSIDIEGVLVDDTGILNHLFIPTDEELNCIFDVEELSEAGYFEQMLAITRASIFMGGNTKVLSQYNLKAFNGVIEMLEEEVKKDLNFDLSTTIKTDSINDIQSRRRQSLAALKEIRDKRRNDFQNKKRLLIDVNVINQSNATVSLLTPALLRIDHEGQTSNYRLQLRSKSSTISMFGTEFFSQSNTFVRISDHAVKEVQFFTKPYESMSANERIRLEDALTQSSAEARISFYCSDKTHIESALFPFSNNISILRSNTRWDNLLKE